MSTIGLIAAKIAKSVLISVLSKLLTEAVAAKIATDLFLDVLKLIKKRDFLKGTEIDDHIIDNLISALDKNNDNTQASEQKNIP